MFSKPNGSNRNYLISDIAIRLGSSGQIMMAFEHELDMNNRVTISKGKIGHQPVLFFYFHYRIDLIDIAKNLGARWSPKRRIWHVNYTASTLRDAQWAFGRVSEVVYRESKKVSTHSSF